MPFVVLGINHRTAPVEIRESVVFSGEELRDALLELAALPKVRESVIVSTCNRTELYCYTEADDTPLAEWLERWHGLASSSIRHCLYRHHDAHAISHAFAVASGLDSLILGEPQILGQLKDAYRAAQETGVTGPYLNRLFQAAFSVAKRVRTQTQIGANSVSVAAAAVSLAHTVFERFEGHTALLVGAGETIALAARHLHAHGVSRMIVANRTLERAQELAAEFKGYAVTLDALEAHLPDADIVVTSTASPAPVVTYKAVHAALKARKRKPMFMVDIAVPRDIEPEVAKLEDVYLFTIDDLQNAVSENLASRREAARTADQLIESEVAHFEQQIRTLDAVPTIRHIRDDAEEIKNHTVEQAMRLLANGRDSKEVLQFLASTLTNRLMHAPSHRLREAAERGESDIIRAAQELFASREKQS